MQGGDGAVPQSAKGAGLGTRQRAIRPLESRCCAHFMGARVAILCTWLSFRSANYVILRMQYARVLSRSPASGQLSAGSLMQCAHIYKCSFRSPPLCAHFMGAKPGFPRDEIPWAGCRATEGSACPVGTTPKALATRSRQPKQVQATAVDCTTTEVAEQSPCPSPVHPATSPCKPSPGVL